MCDTCGKSNQRPLRTSTVERALHDLGNWSANCPKSTGLLMNGVSITTLS